MKLVKVKCNEKVKAFLMIKLGYTPTFLRYRDKISPVLMTYKNFLKKYRNAQLYWIEENNRKIGEICFVLRNDTIHISDFFILNNHQNKGFGQNALELAEDMLCDFRQWHLFTIKQEKRNIHLYEKFGYTATDYERKINKRMTIVEYEKEICKNEHKKIMFPDYDKSILSIAASVLKHYGVTDCPHKTLVELDEILAKNYKNVIVMLFDGLGTDAINYHLDENSFLKQNMLCSVSSVFPPTTTAATTSIQSGYSPIEHGWLGWDLYFKEIDENVAVFRNTLQKNGEKAADYNVAGKYIPCKSIFERIEEKNPDVKACYLSPFSSPAVESFSDIKQAVLKLGSQDGRKCIYTYNPHPDSDMHVFGVTSHAVQRKILEIDSLVKDICSQLEDSVVIVTADHGLIDSKMEFLEDYPVLRNMLKRPASIEPRARSLFVKDGCKEDFKREFNKLFSDKFILMTKQEVYDSHLFGFGKPHPRAEEFIGDFLAVATDDLTLENYREDNPFIGVHAGIDEREVLVPFIVIEKKRK